MAPSSEFGDGKLAQQLGPGSGDRLPDPLPAPEKYEGADKVIIVILIGVLCALFLWLIHSENNLFAYWTFMTMLTLIFVGILRAVGIFRSQGVALGERCHFCRTYMGNIC